MLISFMCSVCLVKNVKKKKNRSLFLESFRFSIFELLTGLYRFLKRSRKVESGIFLNWLSLGKKQENINI